MRVRQEAANLPVFLLFLPFLVVAFSSFNATVDNGLESDIS